jgi:hypothetical protein
VKGLTAIHERYLRDGVPTRLGGLAANLGRIRSFAAHGASGEVVESLMDESAYFIEWTASEAQINVAAELIELQVLLARWRRSWKRIREDPTLLNQVAEEAGTWSQRVLELSGLLSPAGRAAGMLESEGSLTEALQKEHGRERRSGQ